MKHNIPTQKKGRQLDTSQSISFQNNQQAKDFYHIVRNRLLNINAWYQVAKLPLASFQLLDHIGQPKEQNPAIGDYLRINVPGPGLQSTDGYDIVHIDNIEETNEENLQIVTITLRPSMDPTAVQDHEIKHFFSNLATSTLQIKRNEKTIEANYFGRNEVINLDMDHLSEKVRNLLIGVGAKLGFSFPQWKSLMSGLVNNDIITS